MSSHKPAQASSSLSSKVRPTASRSGLPQPSRANASTSSGSTTAPSSGARKSATTTARGTPPASPASTRTRTTSTTRTTSNKLAPPKSPASATHATSPTRTTSKPSSTSYTEPKQNLSIKEVIALKRAEAKKVQVGANSKPLQQEFSFTGLSENEPSQSDEFGSSRWSIRDIIERARSSGSLNLASRSLTSIPSALFKIHLGVEPEPLTIAPKESEEALNAGRTKERPHTAWFEAADLTVLKLRDNSIVELQPEISLFGSLKTLDLRNNQLTFLPDSLSDLINLVTVDLSSNQLTFLPKDISTLPLLTTLDVSSNQLTTIPLSISSPPTSPNTNKTSSFFAPAPVERASEPLPALKYLLASNNKIQASMIPIVNLPPNLVKVDLANNPLGNANALIKAFSKLTTLKELILAATDLHDDSFVAVEGFPVLGLLDLGQTDVSESVQNVFHGRLASFDGEVIEGGVRVILGNRIQKEAWEIEAEKRRRRGPVQSSTQPVKEPWEVDAEMGLLTEGGRRRARFATNAAEPVPAITLDVSPPTPPKSPVTAGTGFSLSLGQYYNAHNLTLTLPRAVPPAHSRTQSLAPTISDGSNALLPLQTLPLPMIIAQPFCQSLRCLILNNRRFDTSFILPTNFIESEPLLPSLEELQLENCTLGDLVTLDPEGHSSQVRKEPIFNVLSMLFPRLSSLDLSDNKLTAMSGIRALLIPDPSRKTKGLRSLRLRGNKISDLLGLTAVAQVLKSEGRVDSWALEELDLRDNEIAKLPPMVGYLLIDVLLVEGNTFRVPARRVWEREGTKGLLNWLKDRVD